MDDLFEAVAVLLFEITGHGEAVADVLILVVVELGDSAVAVEGDLSVLVVVLEDLVEAFDGEHVGVLGEGEKVEGFGAFLLGEVDCDGEVQAEVGAEVVVEAEVVFNGYIGENHLSLELELVVEDGVAEFFIVGDGLDTEAEFSDFFVFEDDGVVPDLDADLGLDDAFLHSVDF